MRTPPIQTRMIGANVAVIALTLVFLGSFVYLSLNSRLTAQLETALEDRADIVRVLARGHSGAELAAALQLDGITATVVEPDGTRHQSRPPMSPLRFDPSGQINPRVYNFESTVLDLDDGTIVEIFASRAPIERSLINLLIVFALSSAFTLIVGSLMVHRIAQRSLKPLNDVAEAAGRTAAGNRGHRLNPDNPTTSLGRMAMAYDNMLDELETALERAGSAEQLTREFVDQAAHQLRTPIAAIRSSIEAAIMEDDPEIRDRLMANLVREARRSDVILSSLLTLARIDRGVKRPRVATNLVTICELEIDRFESLAAGLSFQREFDDRLRKLLLLDEFGMREIFANLLDNARRHARTTITVKGNLLEGEDSPAMVEVRICDDGPGIPAGSDELIFQRFATLDGQFGSGLGLPLARGIARDHGGDVVYDAGVFIVSIPAIHAPTDAAAES